MLVDYELQLFRLADQARNQGVQGAHFETLRIVKQNHADLVPRFLIGLERSLSRIREPITPMVTAPDVAMVGFHDMRLIDDDEADADTVLRTMALRQESRASRHCSCWVSASVCWPVRRLSMQNVCRWGRNNWSGWHRRPARYCRSVRRRGRR